MTRVLVTRPQPDADRTCDLLKSHGFDTVACPLMHIEVTEQDLDLSGIAAIAFTSANGVRAFAAMSNDRSIPAFYVGEASAAEGSSIGLPCAGIAHGDVDSLAALVTSEGPTGTVLHVRGKHQAGDLVSQLTANNIDARAVGLYEAIAATKIPDAAAQAISNGDVIVALYSPRTAGLFGELAAKAGLTPQLRHVTAACLSENVAKVARNFPFQIVMAAEAPEQARFVDMLLSARP